jgi:hypothetical protein
MTIMKTITIITIITMISTGGTITFLETLVNFIIAPTGPIIVLPIGPILDPSPGSQIATIVPITAFAAIGTSTTFTKPVLVSTEF